MLGVNRIVLIVLGFLILVGVFVFVQRGNDVGESGNDRDVVQETTPAMGSFEATTSEPRLIAPADSQTAQGAVSGAIPEQAGEVATQDTGRSAVSTSAGEVAASQRLATDGSIVSGAGAALAPGVSASSGPGRAPDAASVGAGPSPTVNPAMPGTEMISLPPSGPGPEAGGIGIEALAPEHGSMDGAMGPESGSTQGLGPAPELLPVTQPGPSGELPGDPSPSRPAPE